MDFEDLAKIVMVSDPRISPKGDKIAFVASKMDLEADEYVNRVWIADLNKNEVYSLTNGPKDVSPRWSSSGKYIAFTSRRTLKKEERGSELWISRIEGGEPRLVVKVKNPITQVEWLPNEKEMVLLTSEGEIQEDVKVIERLLYWFNGKGFIHSLRQHMYLVNALTGELVQLTKGDLDVNYISVSHDGSKVAYIAKLDDSKPFITDLFIYDFKTQEHLKLTKSNMSIDHVSWSPDDKYLVFRGHDFRRGTISHRHIYVVSSNGGELTDLTANIDRNTLNTLNSDVRGPGREHGPIWIGNYIYFVIHSGGSVNLYRMKFDSREIEVVTSGERSIEAFSGVEVNGKHFLAYTSMTAIEPPELYVWDEESGERKITSFNTNLLAEIELSKPMRFKFKASDGVEIDGWILKPPKCEAKNPALLYIHGGPKTAYGYSFIHEFHLIAAKGYVLIYMNPRGSDGYSEEFADIRGRYGERDYQDLMEGLEYVLKTYDFIDEDRIGVAGGSYGGFMVNWIVTHTDKFRAAISMRGISNWFSFYGVSDIGYWFTLDHILGDLKERPLTRENIMKMIEKSPITYAEHASTPLLIIHSIEDLRCYYEQALQFFTALKWLGKEVRLVLIPKENHDLSRTGKPKHRIERLKHIVKWLDEYLKK